ncbi:hypothetical protein EELLY_v1c04060 [Entomoplasma ellychniae]|uniref:Uncharacterized protein n=1 Tax=Entomoplasma ellychniae TaxID=2114 RepID=A0A8E2UAP1_9MOLU|nr:hypothetical protein [Entomoplasma ellychniae]PPE04726.1 hypothetical protein EELLY_v1c04060 [Entomoplasma ellychniae]
MNEEKIKIININENEEAKQVQNLIILAKVELRLMNREKKEIK